MVNIVLGAAILIAGVAVSTIDFPSGLMLGIAGGALLGLSWAIHFG
jgi:hypothetical protein